MILSGLFEHLLIYYLQPKKAKPDGAVIFLSNILGFIRPRFSSSKSGIRALYFLVAGST